MQLLLPRSLWRPAGPAAAGGAPGSQGGTPPLLQQQLLQALWFAVSSPQHAQLLLECAVTAWQEQVEELEEEADDVEVDEGGNAQGSSQSLATARLASAEAVLSQLTTLSGQRHAVTAGPTAKSAARTMQRALSRTPEQALHSELPHALASLLPLLSAEQAARLAIPLQPPGTQGQGGWGLVAVGCLVAGNGMWLRSWAEASARVWAEKATVTGADAATGPTSDEGPKAAAQLQGILMEALCPSTTAAGQRGEGHGLAAYAVHVMCSSLLRLAALSSTPTTGALERGAQHVAAGVRAVLEQDAGHRGGASTSAAVAKWAQACACLTEVVTCAGRLQQHCGHVPPLLRVAAIAALSCVCPPLGMARAAPQSSTSAAPQQVANILGATPGLQAAVVRALGGVLRLALAEDLVPALQLAALQLLEAHATRTHAGDQEQHGNLDFEQLLEGA
jgi:hypothetical protein